MTVRFTRSLGAWLTVMLLGTSFCPLGISASPAVSAEEAAAGDKTATNLVDTAEATLNSDKEMNEARETDAPLMPVNSKPLTADELSFDGVRLGDTEGNLISAFGVPEKITRGSISTTYEWNGVKAQVIKPLPETSELCHVSAEDGKSRNVSAHCFQREGDYRPWNFHRHAQGECSPHLWPAAAGILE